MSDYDRAGRLRDARVEAARRSAATGTPNKYDRRHNVAAKALREIDDGSVLYGIFRELCANPHGLSTDELIGRLWADDEEGGPLFAKSCVAASIHRFNDCAVKQRLGLRICNVSESGRRYRIFVVREPRA